MALNIFTPKLNIMITSLRTKNRLRQTQLSFLKTTAIVLFFAFAGFNSVQAQVSNYLCDQTIATTATFPLAGKTSLTGTAGVYIDDAVYNVALPFNFSFNGVSYTTANSINVSVNGFITFGATSPTTGNYNPISSTEGYAGAVSIYGRDLDVNTTSTVKNIGYTVTGAVGSRIMKIEWVVSRSNAVGTVVEATSLVMQLWLYEGTNVIDLCYNTYSPATALALTGQIGLRGASNSDFKNLIYTSTTVLWPTAPSVFAFGTLNTDGVVTNKMGAGADIATTSNRTFRWTPVTCFAPALTATTNITNTTATINWNAASPAPGTGYQYIVQTSSTPPSFATTGTAVGTATFSVNLTSLTANTPYYVFVRSVCSGTDSSAWSTAGTFTTLCNPLAVPYYEPFDGPIVSAVSPYHSPSDALPPCDSQQNVGLGNPWTISDNFYYPEAGMTDHMLMYDGQSPGNGNPANVWFFTQGVSLTAGTTYDLDYFYGGTNTSSSIVNKLMAYYGTAPNAASMTLPIDDQPAIKGSPSQSIVPFIAPTTGTYYFGLKAYSAPSQGRLYVDELQVYPSICLKPTNVSVSSVASTSAFLFWTPPSPAPAGGYEYYYSTSSTFPTNNQVPSGSLAAGVNSFSLTGLNSLTSYYFWVRSRCGGQDHGIWTALVNGPNAYFTTLAPLPTYCTPAPTSVDGTGITNVTMGSINNTTGDVPGHYENYTSQVTNTPQGATISFSITFNTSVFDYNTKIWIDFNDNGVFSDAGENVYTGLSGMTSPNTLSGSFVVPAGAPLGQHRMRIGGADINTLTGYGAGQGPCYNSSYACFEDYTVNVVVPPPALTISSNATTLCAGTNSALITITTPLSNFDSYTWSPSGAVTGTAAGGYTINTGTTTTLILTGQQTSAPFSSNTVSFTYTANPIPTPITIAQASPTTCQSGPATLLTASGGVVSGITVLGENFNSTPVGWTNTNTSSGGTTPANSVWTLQPNTYTYGFYGAFHSNDLSQFYISNTDSQGSGGINDTALISPIFSLAGYTAASLSFWHNYRPFNSGASAVVEIFTGGSWTTLQTWTTTTQGTQTNFSNVVLDLTAYAGQSGLQIRFRYHDIYGYWWAIDNFLISGSASSSITWNAASPVGVGAPVPGLYTNAAGTTAYLAGAQTATVYALPTATATFNASASTPSPTICTTTTNTTVTVIPIVAGTASSDQTICSGAPANIVLTGTSGTITGWQYSTNFAFTTPIAIPSSNFATLTSAMMGTITVNTYYRAVVTNGSCTAYSNVISVLFASTTWNGSVWSNGAPTSSVSAIFAGNYTSSGNLSACAATVNSGAVNFLSGHNLILQNALTVTSGSLTFQNNSSLLQVNNVPNSGNITYIRNSTAIRKYDYTYWCSPVINQALNLFSPTTLSDKFLFYNPAINAFDYALSTSAMAYGKGYAIRAPQSYLPSSAAVWAGSFIGVPNNGTNTTAVVQSTSAVSLIGNPYPSALDANLFLSDVANNTVIDGTIYFWTHNTENTTGTYNSSDYASYNYVGSIGMPSPGPANNTAPLGKIAAGQGFFVKVLNTGGNATFRNSMRVSGNNSQFYKNNDVPEQANAISALERNRVWLELTNDDKAYKQALVGYVENATNGLDRGFDGEVFEGGNPINLYSILGNSKLGIQGRALPFDDADLVPLGYTITTPGTYKIKISDFDGFFNNQSVYLEDKLLNIIHDLKSAPYTFVTNQGTFENRFVLRYKLTDKTTSSALFSSDAVVVYKQNESIHLQTSSIPMASLKIYDVRGSLIYTKSNINSNECVISDLNVAQQIILISVTSIDGKTITKKLQF